MDPVPSDSDLNALAAQVDEQLAFLRAAPAKYVRFRSLDRGQAADLPAAPEQQAVIERATGESFETFWQKYLRHARADLCLSGGLLHEQWEKWHDLSSKGSVKVALGVLAGMGIPSANIPLVAVAASVFLLNVVAKVGIESICEGCEA